MHACMHTHGQVKVTLCMGMTAMHGDNVGCNQSDLTSTGAYADMAFTDLHAIRAAPRMLCNQEAACWQETRSSTRLNRSILNL